MGEGKFALVLTDIDIRELDKKMKDMNRSCVVVIVEKLSDDQVTYIRPLEY